VPQLRPIELGDAELRATAYKVIVEPEETVTSSLLTIVRKDEDSFRIGRVLSLGVEASRKLPDVKRGDRVLYAASTACVNGATRGGKPRHIVHHDHVLCAVESES
jgi:co-chaperonin GroES (HSP10)